MLQPTKLVPLSLWIILTFPLVLINRLSAWMKLSRVKLPVILICTVLLDKLANITSCLFWIFLSSLTKNGPNMSTPQKVKEGSPEGLLAGRLPIFCWHIFHTASYTLQIWILVQLIIKYPCLRISFTVIRWPACAIFLWWSLMMACVIRSSLGNKDEYFKRLSKLALLILPTTLNTASLSKNGPNL